MKRIFKYLGILIIALIVVCAFFYFQYTPPAKIDWGLTFSYKEARGLGFNDRIMLLDVLTDLKPKKVRLMTYWNDLEKQKGEFDFSNIDWQLQQAAKYDAEVVLVLGRKQPRWPECFEPDWFKHLSQSEQDLAVLDFVQASVGHFKSFEIVKGWQVENEPYFSFGDACPRISKDLFEKEVSLVKRLDARTVIATDSGERGGWIPVAKSGSDILGSTLYRVSFDSRYGGYYKYPIPAIFYRIKIGYLRTFAKVDEAWDVELQMEPWFTNGAFNTPLDTQKILMNARVFEDNISYAKKTGFSRHYLWGVEWWYWMAKKQNDWGMWTQAKNFFSAN